MSLLDQNWSAGGNVDDEIQDENQQGRQVQNLNLEFSCSHENFF